MTDFPSPADQASLRLIDANLNRTLEALRVLEDVSRFACNSKRLSKLFKTVRGELAALFAPCYQPRVLARDVGSDVGRTLSGVNEYQRASHLDLVAANSERAKQALRVLEEVLKTAIVDRVRVAGDASTQPSAEHRSSSLAQQIEAMRYEVYELEQQLVGLITRADRLERRSLYVLANASQPLQEFRKTIEQICAAGVDVIQLRDKNADDRKLVEYARHLVEVTRQHHVLSIINDRPDIAVISDADGVHVGQEELSVSDCRRIVGHAKLVGLSTHDPQQVSNAALEEVDYIGFGPLFPSQTKSFEQTLGIEVLPQIVEASDFPVFGIGGVTLERLPALLRCGLQRVAVSAAIFQADDPALAAAEFRKLLTSQASSND